MQKFSFHYFGMSSCFGICLIHLRNIKNSLHSIQIVVLEWQRDNCSCDSKPQYLFERKINFKQTLTELLMNEQLALKIKETVWEIVALRNSLNNNCNSEFISIWFEYTEIFSIERIQLFYVFFFFIESVFVLLCCQDVLLHLPQHEGLDIFFPCKQRW